MSWGRGNTRNHFFKHWIFLMLACLPWCLHAEVKPQDRRFIPKAIELRVTQNGMKYFDLNLTDVIVNLGYDLTEGYFGGQSFESEKSISPDDIEKYSPEFAAVERKLKVFLSKWLRDLKAKDQKFLLNDHQPALVIGETGYIADLERFSLRSTPELVRSPEQQKGVLLTFEVRIKQLIARTEKTILYDKANPRLGKYTLVEPKVTLDGREVPLLLSIPFLVKLSATGVPSFEALSISHNLKDSKIDLSFKDILTPRFGIVVDDEIIPINDEPLKQLIQDQRGFGVTKIKEQLDLFIHRNLLTLLNTEAKKFFTKPLDIKQLVGAAGKPEGAKGQDFDLLLRVSGVGQSEHLWFQMDALMEDPEKAPLETPLWAQTIARGRPQFDTRPSDQYDIALSLDQGLINRILQLSWNRGYLRESKLESGETLKIRTTPFFVPTKQTSTSPLEAEMLLNLWVVAPHKRAWYETFFIPREIELKLPVVVKLYPNPKGRGMNIKLWDLDWDHIEIPQAPARPYQKISDSPLSEFRCDPNPNPKA
jgi:hypothetical protein